MSFLRYLNALRDIFSENELSMLPGVEDVLYLFEDLDPKLIDRPVIKYVSVQFNLRDPNKSSYVNPFDGDLQ